MRYKRAYHSIRLSLLRTYGKRAKYVKEHDILGGMGEKCKWGPALLPIYPKLIKIHDNVFIHKTAKLVPHDMINRFLKKADPESDFGFEERLGCIEIMDNVYVSMNCIILPNVRIGKNCIITAGSVVTGDIPENSIVAGNPAKVIGRFDAYLSVRQMEKDYNIIFTKQNISDEVVDIKWKEFENQRYLKNSVYENYDIDTEEVQVFSETEERVIKVVSSHIDGIDFRKENDLIGRHVLDSLGIIMVTDALESEFKCKIPYDRINSQNFCNVRNMAKMMEDLLNNTGKTSDSEEYVNSIDNKEQPVLELDESLTQKSIVQRIFENSFENPDDPAIIANDRIYSYKETSGMIYSIGNWLKSQGVKEGDRVIIQAVHDEICITTFFAIQLIGAIMVPVEKTAPEYRMIEIARESESSFIICIKPNNRHSNWKSYDDIRKISHNETVEKDTKIIYPDLDLPAEMYNTTGTTGKSKGVLKTHRATSMFSYSVAKHVQLRKKSKMLITTPLNHGGAMIMTILTLGNGCCAVYMDGISDIKKYFDCIRKYNINTLWLVPTSIRILLSRAKEEFAKFKDQIDFIYTSSAMLPEGDCIELRDMFPDTRLFNAYEATESIGICSYNYNTKEMKKNCLGKANEGVEIGIMKDDGEIVHEPGIKGQICIKSCMTMKEYYNEPELTAQVLKGEWYISSDMGYLDDEDYLYYAGRAGDVINIGGYKIAPTDVEDVAILSGLIDDCICIEEFNEFGIPYLKLLVVVKDKDKFDPKPLTKYMSDKLEAYKIPRKIELTDEVKKTFNGKIDRKAYKKN